MVAELLNRVNHAFSLNQGSLDNDSGQANDRERNDITVMFFC